VFTKCVRIIIFEFGVSSLKSVFISSNMVWEIVPWLGYGSAPWLGSSLSYLMSGPFWHIGIIPCLILKILLLKGSLLLAPPIALGAFVLGQGSGLLIGKLAGMKLMMDAIEHHQHNSRDTEFDALKSVLGAIVSWKRKQLGLDKLPPLPKLLPTFPPSPLSFFKPTRRTNYTKNTYAAYKDSPGGWDVKTSDWLSGPISNYVHTQDSLDYSGMLQPV